MGGAGGTQGTASGTLYADAQYGSGSFTYAFSKVSGYGQITGYTSNSVSLSLQETIPTTGGKTNTYSGVFRVVVTDTVYSVTQTLDLTVNFQYTNNA